MLYFLKNLLSILLNQVGEEGGDDGSGGAPGDGSGAAPDAGDGSGEYGQGEGTPGDGQGGAPKESSRYGDFGENPTVDQMYEHIQNSGRDHETLRTKTAQTEQNLASLRQSVEGSGLKILTDSQGNIQIVPKETPAAKATPEESLFTDEHSELFEKPVLEAIRSLIADNVKKMIKDYDGTRFTDKDNQWVNRTSFQQKSVSARNQMSKLYPQLLRGKDGFDQSFHLKATQIWENSYKHLPNGELIAAHEAAAEMGISPSQLMKAKKEGFDQGRQEKKVLGPANRGGQQGASGAFRKLNKADYLALPSDEKEAYDKKTLDLAQKH